MDVYSCRQIQAAFALFDTDKSGTLTPSELKAILTRPLASSLPLLTDAEIDELVKQHDSNGDGVLSIDEFAVAWSSLAQVMPGGAIDTDDDVLARHEVSDPDYTTLYRAIDLSLRTYTFTVECDGFDDIKSLQFDTTRPQPAELRSRIAAELETERERTKSELVTGPLKIGELTLRREKHFNSRYCYYSAVKQYEYVPLVDPVQLDSLLTRSFNLDWPDLGTLDLNSSQYKSAANILERIEGIRVKVRSGKHPIAQARTTVADSKPVAIFSNWKPIVLTTTLKIDDAEERRKVEEAAANKQMLSSLHPRERDQFPPHLRERGIVLAERGVGGTATGGGMSWETHLAVYNPADGLVTIVSFNGSDSAGVRLALQGPMTPAKVPRRTPGREALDFKDGISDAGRSILKW